RHTRFSRDWSSDVCSSDLITRVIRQVRPELVITHHPDRNYEAIAPSHPDHRAVGGATLDAVYPDARNPYAFQDLLDDEGLEAWKIGRASCRERGERGEVAV